MSSRENLKQFQIKGEFTNRVLGGLGELGVRIGFTLRRKERKEYRDMLIGNESDRKTLKRKFIKHNKI